MSESLAHIREKLKRADEHIKDFGTEADAFRDETPNRELVDYNTQTAEAFKEFHRQRRIPPRLSVLSGDVLYQLRSSLDHLACALIVADGGTITEKSQFPICRFKPVKPKDVRRYQGQIEGITRPDVTAAIQRLQPYTAGDKRYHHWLSILKTFSNTDKHRSLVLHTSAVQPRISWVSIWPKTGFEGDSDHIDDGTEIHPGTQVILGDEVKIMNVQRRLTTFVAFAEWPGAPYEFPAEYGLASLWRGVNDVVSQFERFLL